MYAGVPNAAMFSSRKAESGDLVGTGRALCDPEVEDLMSPCGYTRMFAGLTSRWTTPRSCACASPRATAAPMTATTSGASVGFFGERWRG